MAVTFSKIRGSEKSAHQTVKSDGLLLGEVWREAVRVRSDGYSHLLWRWFAKAPGSVYAIGHGIRLPAMNGAGFISKERAVEVLLQLQAACS